MNVIGRCGNCRRQGDPLIGRTSCEIKEGHRPRFLPSARSISDDLKSENVGSDGDVRDSVHPVGVAQSSGTAHFPQERLHDRQWPLYIDKNRSVGSVLHRADHPVTTRCLSYAHPVVHSLHAADRDTLPVHDGVHDTSNAASPKSLLVGSRPTDLIAGTDPSWRTLADVLRAPVSCGLLPSPGESMPASGAQGGGLAFEPPLARVGTHDGYLAWEAKARRFSQEAGRVPESLDRVDATIYYAPNRITRFGLPDPRNEISVAELLAHEVLHAALERPGGRSAARSLDSIGKAMGDARRYGGT